MAADSFGQEFRADLEPLPYAGLLSEDVIHRDMVAECRGLPAAMEYADVSLTHPALATACCSTDMHLCIRGCRVAPSKPFYSRHVTPL